ncbi:MAG: hypothetical protein R2874_10310 [Desulfobacterales bacterium]
MALDDAPTRIDALALKNRGLFSILGTAGVLSGNARVSSAWATRRCGRQFTVMSTSTQLSPPHGDNTRCIWVPARLAAVGVWWVEKIPDS